MESEQNLALTLLRMNMFEDKATRSRMKRALMRRTLLQDNAVQATDLGDAPGK